MFNFFKKTIAALPAIILMTLLNVIITYTVSTVVLMEMITAGYDKHLSFVCSVVSGIIVYSYIVFNHKLRNYIKKIDQGEKLDE